RWCNNQGPDKRVPAELEANQAKRDQRWRRIGQHYPPQRAEQRAAIDARRFFELARQPQEELPQQEHAHWTGHERNDQRLVRVDPAQGAHFEVQRNRQNLERNDHRRQKRDEQRVAAWEWNTREDIGGGGVDDQ